MPHSNQQVAQKLLYIFQSSKHKNSASAILAFAYLQNAFSGLWPVWHGEGWAAALLSWAFLSADFCYRITNWQNNAWQELIKDCNMNPCRAHWGKFVIGTVFLCLHEQKLGLTVSLISSFGSVWTLCYSVLLFLHFSLWEQQSHFWNCSFSECAHPDPHCYTVLSNAILYHLIWSPI